MKIKVSSTNRSSSKIKELSVNNLHTRNEVCKDSKDFKTNDKFFRSKSINLSIEKLADKINLDPILNTFKINVTLNEFYFKRVLEMLDESLRSEKENTLNKTLKEKENLVKTIDNLKKENSILTKKIDDFSYIEASFKKKLEDLRSELKSEKDILLNNLKQLEKINQEKNNLLIANQQLSDEKTSLKILIDQLEIENQKLCLSVRDSEYKYNKELELKNQELEYFKQHFLDIKAKQVEIVNLIEKTTKENFDMKLEIQANSEQKDKLTKIVEALENKVNDYDLIKENFEKLNLQVESVYKPKIKALQSKLKEKLNLLKNSEENI